MVTFHLCPWPVASPTTLQFFTISLPINLRLCTVHVADGNGGTKGKKQISKFPSSAFGAEDGAMTWTMLDAKCHFGA